jgi:hypothetical protein
MTITLLSQPGYAFIPLTTPEALAPLDAFVDKVEFYDVALNVGEPLTAASLRDLVAVGDLFVWRMQATEARANKAMYALLSRYAMAEQAYVYCPQGWDNLAVAAGLEALTQAVFTAKPDCEDVWVGLPLPQPQDAEETLLIMGYTYTPSNLDKDIRRTFGLSRQVYMAYHADNAEDA